MYNYNTKFKTIILKMKGELKYMKKPNEESLKVTIKYSDNPDSWNNFVNFLISFMIDSNIIGEINKNDECN